MTEVAAPIWNAIAKTQRLETAAAKIAFRLDGEQIARMSDYMVGVAEELEIPSELARRLPKYLPLVAEGQAVKDFVTQHASHRNTLPVFCDANEAAAVAATEWRLQDCDRAHLKDLLLCPALLTVWTLAAKAASTAGLKPLDILTRRIKRRSHYRMKSNVPAAQLKELRAIQDRYRLLEYKSTSIAKPKKSLLSAETKKAMREAFRGLVPVERPVLEAKMLRTETHIEIDRELFFSIGRSFQRGIGKDLLGSVIFRVRGQKLTIESKWGGGEIPCNKPANAFAVLSGKSFCRLITSRYQERKPSGKMAVVFRPKLRELAIDRLGVRARFP